MRWKKNKWMKQCNYLKLERKTLFSTSRYVCQSIHCLSIKYSPLNILSTRELYRYRSNQISCFNRLIGFSISFFIRSSTLNLIVDLYIRFSLLCTDSSPNHIHKSIFRSFFPRYYVSFLDLRNYCEKRDFLHQFHFFYHFSHLINMKF